MPAALDWLERMVAINSFTENPDGVAQLGRLTALCFAPLGFAAEFVPSTNPAWGPHLVLTRPGSGTQCLALISHLDTVFPPEEEQQNQFRWQPEGDRIFGPGTHDIKGGTVMIWLVLQALAHFSPDPFGRVLWRVILNSSEEAFSPDFRHVCLQRMPPTTRAALVFEAEGFFGGRRRLVVARKGRATWRLTVHGRGAHAGAKHQRGANAIVQLGRVLDRIAGLTDYAAALTVNPGRVSGGTVLNRVPHEAIAEGELRAFAPDVFTRAKNHILALNGPGDVTSPVDQFACQVKAEILSESRPWPRNPATDALLAVWQDAAEDLGFPVDGEERGGLSDGNLLWDAVPSLDGLGPRGDNDHCSERSPDGTKLPEYVERSSFVPKAALNTLAILRLLSGDAGKIAG